MDKEFDDAEGRVKDAEADLAEYLQQIRRQLGAGKDLCYITVNKDANLLEIPQVSVQQQQEHLMPSMAGSCHQEHIVHFGCTIHALLLGRMILSLRIPAPCIALPAIRDAA